MLLWLVLTCCFTPLDPFFGPQGMELVLPTRNIFGQIGKKKVTYSKKEPFQCSFFNKLISTQKLKSMNYYLVAKNVWNTGKVGSSDSFFFWLTYIILFTSLQKRVGCIWLFFELQFNCIDLWPLLLLVAASAISCGS